MSTQNGSDNGSTGFDWSDPMNLVPHNGPGNSARRVFFDPGGLWEESGLWHPPDDPETAAEKEAREEAAKQVLRERVNSMYADGPGTQLAKEAEDLGKANRSYYTDDLNRNFSKAERNTRFNLARQGLLGGSEDSDRQAEVRSDRDLGATRLDDAVRQSVNALRTQREQERLRATMLINAGEGDNAILAASTGLQNSLEAAKTANKVNLFGDLFANTADAAAAQNANAANAALLARYKQQLATYFPAGDSSQGGRVTATQ